MIGVHLLSAILVAFVFINDPAVIRKEAKCGFAIATEDSHVAQIDIQYVYEYSSADVELNPDGTADLDYFQVLLVENTVARLCLREIKPRFDGFTREELEQELSHEGKRRMMEERVRLLLNSSDDIGPVVVKDVILETRWEEPRLYTPNETRSTQAIYCRGGPS